MLHLNLNVLPSRSIFSLWISLTYILRSTLSFLWAHSTGGLWALHRKNACKEDDSKKKETNTSWWRINELWNKKRNSIWFAIPIKRMHHKHINTWRYHAFILTAFWVRYRLGAQIQLSSASSPIATARETWIIRAKFCTNTYGIGLYIPLIKNDLWK